MRVTINQAKAAVMEAIRAARLPAGANVALINESADGFDAHVVATANGVDQMFRITVMDSDGKTQEVVESPMKQMTEQKAARPTTIEGKLDMISDLTEEITAQIGKVKTLI